MTDDQFETLFRKYRPAAPGPTLRARVLAAAQAPMVSLGVLDWALVGMAASLVIAAASVHWRAGVAGNTRDPLTSAYFEHLDNVTADLGGDIAARQLAVVVVSAERPDRSQEQR